MAWIKTQRRKRLEMIAWANHKKRYFGVSGFYDVNCPRPKPWDEGEIIEIKCLRCDNKFNYSGPNLHYVDCPECSFGNPLSSLRKWIGVDERE